MEDYIRWSLPGGKECKWLIAWTMFKAAVRWIAAVWSQCRLNQQCSDTTCSKNLALCSLQQFLSYTTYNPFNKLFILCSDRRSWTCCSMFRMLQHVCSQGPGNMSMVCHGWCMITCTGWLFHSECSTSLLWQSIVVFGTELQGTSLTTVCQSPKFLVAKLLRYAICHQLSVPRVRRSILGTRAFSVAGPTIWYSLPDLRDTALNSEQFRLDLHEDVSVCWTFVALAH